MEKEKCMTFRQVMDYIEEVKKLKTSLQTAHGRTFAGRSGNGQGHSYGSKPAASNMESLCEKLGHPQRELTFIHLTGRSGKSSVAALLSEVLKASGYRTGRYMSPALFERREKIQIGGRSISQKEYCRQMTLLKALCQELVMEGKPHPTVHELEMAMAFQYFKEQRCEIVVWETDLADAPDVFKIAPSLLVCVFTSIRTSDADILGEILTRISESHEGIMKAGFTTVALMREPEVMEVLQERTEAFKIPLITADPSKAKGVRRNLEKQTFSYGAYKNLTMPLLGTWQIENGVLAIEAIKQLREKGFSIPEKSVYKGFSAVSLPGRFQILAKKPYFIVDGAKDGDSAERLAETIRFYFTGRKMIYIIGMLRDSEQEEMIRQTGSLAEQILTIPTKGERGLSSYELACGIRQYHDHVTAVDSMEEAVELAYLLADKETVMVAFGPLSNLGSLIRYVGEASSKKNERIGKDLHGLKRENLV